MYSAIAYPVFAELIALAILGIRAFLGQSLTFVDAEQPLVGFSVLQDTFIDHRGAVGSMLGSYCQRDSVH